jgi:YHS domain-containing protein
MGTRYCFCSQGCMETFEKDPAKYVARSTGVLEK